MAEKTYLTHRPSLSIAWERPTDIAGRSRNVTLNFVGGALTTDDEDAQKYLEGLPVFKDETIYLKTHAEDVKIATAEAVALRNIADRAETAAKVSEAKLAALQKPAAASAK